MKNFVVLKASKESLVLRDCYTGALEGPALLPYLKSIRNPLRRRQAGSRSQVTVQELYARVAQAGSKRIDLMRFYLGFSPQAELLADTSRAGGRFFFSSEDLPLRADLLQRHLSTDAKAIIREADNICDHRFRLLGYEGLDYGREIDWHYDAVHRIRSPLRPAHKIAFLDHSLVGDHKVIWELNRHQHLVSLAKAWLLTGKEKYPIELSDQWYSWKRANPYPLGINWASALEVAFRSLSWLWVRFLLLDCSVLPVTFKHDLLTALALNGRFIECYLSTYFSPNTHLLGELTALFFLGVLCPQISNAERWRNLGWNGLLSEAPRQVRSDGVYFEQSLYYHVYALDFFLHARVLALVNGIEVPGWFDVILEKMLVFLRIMTQAAPAHTFGDDDGGRVFNPARNRREHLTDPLALGALLFDRQDLTTVPATQEAVWLFGERAFESFPTKSALPSSTDVSFEAAGIYVIASSEPETGQMVIDAGPVGVGNAGHGHADALSATLSFDQRAWLIDPGTFVYVPENSRNQFRHTTAHNTWTVDGLDQAEAAGPFAWTQLPEVRKENWTSGRTFSLFAGSHNGYSRLSDPVNHRRYVFHARAQFWLVRDVLDGRGVHDCASSWHFAPDLEVQQTQAAFIATPIERTRTQSSRLALVPLPDSAWHCELISGATSPVYGISESATVLRIRGRVQLPVESALLMIPFFSPEEKPGSFSVAYGDRPGHDSVKAYVYSESGRSHFMIFANRKEDWELDPWFSDANFIYCCMRSDELDHLIVCGASFLQFASKSIFAYDRKVEWLEWSAQDRASAFSSDKVAALHLSKQLQGCLTALH